eukprot:7667571-Pyramimonas_sp.AAC.1
MKAFEQVGHHWLLEAAVDTGFPPSQLKLNAELYRAERFCCLGQVASSPMKVEQAAPPGGGRTTCMLEVILIWPLVSVHHLHRAVAPAVVVDDLSLHCIGMYARVTRALVQASLALQEALAQVNFARARRQAEGIMQRAEREG